MTVNEKGYAKLNYSLDVHARRPDGYHDLTMVMGSVSLWDDVDVTLRRDACDLRAGAAMVIAGLCARGVTLVEDIQFIERGYENFVGKLRLLGADIRIKKRVPVGAGMAGGSTDAAAVLRALNVLTGANFSAEQLRTLALTVGSDVPYCVTGGMMLAVRGERSRRTIFRPFSSRTSTPTMSPGCRCC